MAASAALARVRASRPWPLSRSQLVLPLLVAASTQLDVWPSPLNLGHVEGPRPILASLYAVTSLALVWRRRAALSVLAFVTLADVAYYLAYGAPEGLGSVIPALVAWYAVGRYGPARQFVPGAALVVLGIAAHELRDPAFRFGGLEVVLWAVVAAGWPVGYAFAQRAREARELVDSREEMARRAVSEERARIARELHDVVGHGISVAVLQMVAAVSLLENGATEPARVRLLNAERSAREALAEMRRLLGLMDSSPDAALAPQPGLNQLDKLIEDTRSAGATLHVAFEGEPVALPAGLDLAAFRIVQEALTNVLKHASPPSADVRLVYRTDRLDIEVRDHGGPGSTDGISEGGGRGLAGMRERARIYDGGLRAGRCEDGGYLVQAWLPVGTP